jgi:ankyrin repeat protein
VAASENQPEMVQFLLDSKANVNAKDNFDNSPLSKASQKGYKDIVDLLRKHGGR